MSADFRAVESLDHPSSSLGCIHGRKSECSFRDSVMCPQEKCQAVSSRILSSLPVQRKPLISAVMCCVPQHCAGDASGGGRTGWVGGKRLRVGGGCLGVGGGPKRLRAVDGVGD